MPVTHPTIILVLGIDLPSALFFTKLLVLMNSCKQEYLTLKLTFIINFAQGWHLLFSVVDNLLLLHDPSALNLLSILGAENALISMVMLYLFEGQRVFLQKIVVLNGTEELCKSLLALRSNSFIVRQMNSHQRRRGFNTCNQLKEYFFSQAIV